MSSNKVLYEVGTRVQTVEPPYFSSSEQSDRKIGEFGTIVKISIHSRNRENPIILYTVRFDNIRYRHNNVDNQYLDRALKNI
jgi:hypothetical protein